MIEYILNPQSVEALGWTLLHSLWQGAIFAILLVLILIALRSYTAQSRYLVSVGLLCAFFLTVSATFWQQWQGANNRLELTAQQFNNQMADDVLILNNSSEQLLPLDIESKSSPLLSSEMSTNEKSSWLLFFTDYYERHLPLLVTFWLLGILFLQLRFLGQLAYVQRLKHYGTRLFPKSWGDKLEELEDKLRIQKKVRYLTSFRVESPMVIGWLKPVVLVPHQIFNSLSETEIYAVLAHELAHIRREDFIVNLMQTFLCNIFFFHPGVWWMSNRIDDEREHCCDDLAVAATGRATSYAKTLISVSELQLKMQENPVLAMALSGKNKKRERGGFSARIHRLFMGSNGVGNFREGFATACILITALLIGVVATGSTGQASDSVTPTEMADNKSSESNEMDKTETIANTESPIKNELKQKDKKPITTTTTTTIISDDYPISNVKATIDLSDLPLEEAAKVVALDVLYDDTENKKSCKPNPESRERDSDTGETNSAEYGSHSDKFDNEAAIHQATKDGLIEKVVQMVEQGTDVNTRDDYGRTALHIASALNHNIDMGVLIDLGADINAQDSQGRTPLMYAAADGNRSAVKLLVSKGVKVNIRDVDGMRAYDWAHTGGITDMAEFMDSISDKDQEKSRQKQFQKNIQKEMQKELKKALQNEREKRETFHINDGSTHLKQYNIEKEIPELFNAIRDESAAYVSRLLNNGLSANSADDTGQTALMVAARQNRLDMAKLLIEEGADVNRSSASGLTALHYAALENHDEMAQLLLQYNANVDPQMRYSSTDGNYSKEPLVWEYVGATPLLIAVESGHTEVLTVLINGGANRNHTLTRNEYRLSKNRNSYLSASEVTGLDQDFLNNVKARFSDDSWTPYKQALLLNDPAILAYFPL